MTRGGVRAYNGNMGQEERIARAVVRRYYYGIGEAEDLVQEGIMGIVRARERYEAGRGASFTTYAYKSARNAICRYLKKEAEWRRHVVSCEYDVAVETSEGFAEGYIEEIREWLGLKEGTIGAEIMKGRRQSDIAKEFGVSRQLVSKEFSKIKKMVLSRYELKGGELICRAEI